MSALLYRTRTTRRWLLSQPKKWLADEVLFLMNELGEPHSMRTSGPLQELYTKEQLADRYSALAARLPDDEPALSEPKEGR